MEAGPWRNTLNRARGIAAMLPYLALGLLLIAWVLEGDPVLAHLFCGIIVGFAGGFQFVRSDRRTLDKPVIGNLLILLAFGLSGLFGFLVASGSGTLFGDIGSTTFVCVLTTVLIGSLYWASAETRFVTTLFSLSIGGIGTVMVVVAMVMGISTDGTPLAALDKIRGASTRWAAVAWSFTMPLGLIGAGSRWWNQYRALPKAAQEAFVEHTKEPGPVRVVKLVLALLAVAASLAGLTGLATTFEVFELLTKLL